LAADAGYDSESNYHYPRDDHEVRTVIPPKHGRPSPNPAVGRYGRLMQRRFDRTAYRENWKRFQEPL
jgi:hypothetical protein